MIKKANLAICEILYKLFYKIFSKFNINERQCVFCSMEGKDTFGNLDIVKKYMSSEYTCFSCYGKINTPYKAYRTAKKIAGARIIFLNAAYTYTSIINVREKSKVVQLWHAAGAFKKFGMHSIDKNDKNALEKQKKMHGYYDHVIVSSEGVRSIYAEAFNMDKEKVLAYGLPRIEELHKLNKERKNLLKWLCIKYDKCWYKKIILYAPTFREVNKKRDYKPVLDIKKFASELPNDYILALRLHPRAPKLNIELPKNVVNFSSLPQDIALICSDILITDYSSVVFDFASLKKPFFFYTPDEFMYNRGLYFSPEKEYRNITFADYYDMANMIIKINIDKKCRLLVEQSINKLCDKNIDVNTHIMINIKNFISTI